MYESHFGLLRRPFLATPDPDCFVACESIENALAGLRLCVEARKGFGILSAPAGLGKTLLCRRLIVELRDQFATVYLANSNFSSGRSLLQAILYELGRPYLRMDEQELRLGLKTAAASVRPDRQAVLLVVDEAHLLSHPLLEELRTAADVDVDGSPLIYVILSGQLPLEEKLAGPELEALNQRIGCQVTLEALTRQESAEYVTERLRWAGADVRDVIQPDAMELMCHAADGSPRCLNQLCDHALLLAYVADENPVSEATIREALDDLRQLPLHWNDPLPAVADTPAGTADEGKVSRETAGPIDRADSESTMSQDAADDHRESCETESAVEIGETCSVEVGAPMPACEIEFSEEIRFADGDEAESAAVLEFAAIDSAQENLDGAMDDAGETTAMIDYEAAAVESAAAISSRPFGENRDGFEEVVVFDRYAMLDAGLPVDVDASVRPAAGVTSLSGAAVDVADADPAPLEMVGGLVGEQTPEQLIDAIEPLVSQVLNEDCTWDEETIASVSESVVGAAVTEDESVWTCIPMESPHVDAEAVSIEDVMPAEAEEVTVEPCEYDVVQPEREVVAEAEISPASEPAAESKPRGRYAHLFSKLRRRQRSA